MDELIEKMQLAFFKEAEGWPCSSQWLAHTKKAMTDGVEGESEVSDGNWETQCPRSEDKQHCLCWYDGKPCCRCGDAMNYGEALQAINDSDAKIQRIGWNGRGQFVGQCLVGEGGMMTVPFLYLKTVSGDLVPWVPSQTDQLAKDWQIVE